VPETRWPNLFLVGAPKAGTTSLWHYLGAHPEVHLGALKEPHFFTSQKRIYVETVKDEVAYLRLFAGARGARYLCDASGSYLHDPSAPESIRRVSPDARIVVSLREPVARAFSSYLHAITFGERRSFEDALRGAVAEEGGSPGGCFPGDSAASGSRFSRPRSRSRSRTLPLARFSNASTSRSAPCSRPCWGGRFPGRRGSRLAGMASAHGPVELDTGSVRRNALGIRPTRRASPESNA
jgi:hypothetical protein